MAEHLGLDVARFLMSSCSCRMCPRPRASKQAATHEVSERSERGAACWLAQGLGV